MESDLRSELQMAGILASHPDGTATKQILKRRGEKVAFLWLTTMATGKKKVGRWDLYQEVRHKEETPAG